MRWLERDIGPLFENTGKFSGNRVSRPTQPIVKIFLRLKKARSRFKYKIEENSDQKYYKPEDEASNAAFAWMRPGVARAKLLELTKYTNNALSDAKDSPYYGLVVSDNSSNKNALINALGPSRNNPGYHLKKHHFIIQGLREIEGTMTGESTPYMHWKPCDPKNREKEKEKWMEHGFWLEDLNRINDGEIPSYNVYQHYEFLPKNLRENVIIFCRDIPSDTFPSSMWPTKFALGVTVATAAAVTGWGAAGLGAGAVAAYLGAKGTVATTASAAGGVIAAPLEAGIVAVGKGLGKFSEPSIFGKSFGRNYGWNLIGSQLYKACASEQPNLSLGGRAAILFGHHKSFANLLDLKKSDKGKDNPPRGKWNNTSVPEEHKKGIGIKNNAMLIFYYDGYNVKHMKVLNPDTRFDKFSSPSKYRYIKDTETLKWGNDSDAPKLIANQMQACKLEYLILYRHGTALHNIFEWWEKGDTFPIETKNSRLFPSDMVEGGVIQEQGKKLATFFKKQVEMRGPPENIHPRATTFFKKQVEMRGTPEIIAWCCSDLARTQQTLTACRLGYERERQALVRRERQALGRRGAHPPPPISVGELQGMNEECIKFSLTPIKNCIERMWYKLDPNTIQLFLKVVVKQMMRWKNTQDDVFNELFTNLFPPPLPPPPWDEFWKEIEFLKQVFEGGPKLWADNRFFYQTIIDDLVKIRIKLGGKDIYDYVLDLIREDKIDLQDINLQEIDLQDINFQEIDPSQIKKMKKNIKNWLIIGPSKNFLERARIQRDILDIKWDEINPFTADATLGSSANSGFEDERYNAVLKAVEGLNALLELGVVVHGMGQEGGADEEAEQAEPAATALDNALATDDQV